MENEKGRVRAFSTLSPFKSWWARMREKLVYVGAPEFEPDIRARKFLHFAYWLSFPPGFLARIGLAKEDRPKHGALLFLSAFNGDADDYVGAFSAHLPGQMNELWKQCEEWDGAEDVEKLKSFIARYRRPTSMFFHAYGDDAKRIRAALLLRLQLERLATENSGRASTDRGVALARELSKLAASGGVA